MLKLAAIALMLLSSVVGAADEFQWSSEVVDFRSVPIGAELTQEVRLTNRGNKTWRIVGTTTTCGCATATGSRPGTLEASREILKPGEAATIFVKARPKRLGPSNGALFLKLEEAGENSGGVSESVGVDIRLRGVRPCALLKNEFELGGHDAGKKFARSVALELASGEPFLIEEVRTNGGPLRYKQEDRPAASQSLMLELLPETRPGPFSDVAVLDLMIGERREQAVIRLSGTIATDFVWTPNQVVLTPDRETEISIQSRTKASFEIDECLSKTDDLTMVPRSIDGSGHRIVVRWTPTAIGAARRGELVFKVAGHAETRLTIPVQFLRPEPDRKGRQ